MEPTRGPFTGFFYVVLLWAMGLHSMLAIIPTFLHMGIDIFACVYIGAYHSLYSDPLRKPWVVRDCWRYPLYATLTLLGVYLLILAFGKDIANKVLTIYLCFIGTFAVKDWLIFVFSKEKSQCGYFRAPTSHIVLFVLSALLCIFNAVVQDWVSNNVISLCFALYAIKYVHCRRFAPTTLMLVLYVLYDVFFVFFSGAMAEVANTVTGPVKLLLPPLGSRGRLAFIGLGDIMIPGVLIALCLRFDFSRSTAKTKGSNYPRPYFKAAMWGYVAGFLMTIVANFVLRRSLPALLWLVPGTVAGVGLAAIRRGELGVLLQFDGADAEDKAQDTEKT